MGHIEPDFVAHLAAGVAARGLGGLAVASGRVGGLALGIPADVDPQVLHAAFSPASYSLRHPSRCPAKNQPFSSAHSWSASGYCSSSGRIVLLSKRWWWRLHP